MESHSTASGNQREEVVGTAVQVIVDIDVATDPSTRLSTRSCMAEQKTKLRAQPIHTEPEHSHDHPR